MAGQWFSVQSATTGEWVTDARPATPAADPPRCSRFHFKCVDLTKKVAERLSEYICPPCETKTGKKSKSEWLHLRMSPLVRAGRKTTGRCSMRALGTAYMWLDDSNTSSDVMHCRCPQHCRAILVSRHVAAFLDALEQQSVWGSTLTPHFLQHSTTLVRKKKTKKRRGLCEGPVFRPSASRSRRRACANGRATRHFLPQPESRHRPHQIDQLPPNSHEDRLDHTMRRLHQQAVQLS